MMLIFIPIILFFFLFLLFHAVYGAAWGKFVYLDNPRFSLYQMQIFEETDNWAALHGFIFAGNFRWQVDVCSVWIDAGRASIVVLHFLSDGTVSYELSTEYKESISVNTDNNKYAALVAMPCLPNYYTASFPGKTLDEIWQIHIAAEEYLNTYGGVHLLPRSDFQELVSKDSGRDDYFKSAIAKGLTAGLRNGSRYLRSFWFWQFRAVYWWFYRKHFWKNYTVKEQVKMGQLVLPKDLPLGYERHIVHWYDV